MPAAATCAGFAGLGTPLTYRRVPHAGHNLPQENPAASTAPVLDLVTPARPAHPQLHRPSSRRTPPTPTERQ
jgi:hypothetical protein